MKITVSQSVLTRGEGLNFSFQSDPMTVREGEENAK